MCKIFRVLIVLSLPIVTLANVKNKEINRKLVQANLTQPLINELVAITPIENHHFNLEAPQKCGKESSIEKTARKIICQFHKSGEKQVTVSVCDNQKNYCKQETLKLSVLSQSSETPRIKAPAKNETVKMQKKTKALLMQDFVSILPEELPKAMKGKKGAVVMVSTDWCPPCNVAKEFMLPTKEFKEATKDLLLVYVDGDGPAMTAWNPVLQTFYYPSFVYINKDGERVDLITGYDYFTEFNKWLAKARSRSYDSLADLEKRITERREGKTLRKVKDFFVSNDKVRDDQDRWLDYLENTAQLDEALHLVEHWKRYDQEFLQARLHYSELWFGQLSSQIDPQEKKKQMDRLAKKMLVELRPKDLTTHWIIGYLVQTYCSTESQEEKNMINTEQCKKLHKQIIHDKQTKKNKLWANLMPAEKHIEEALLYQTTAEVMRGQGLNQVADQSYKRCGEEWSKTAQYSPLGEKSRSSRMQKIGCVKNLKDFNNVALIESLVSDYPYDATFHGMLASHHLKQKNYRQALKANSKALQYSYGDSWGKNLVKRVQILKGLGQKALALKTIRDNLKEITLDKNNKKQWWLNSLRTHQKELEAQTKSL